MLSRPGVIPGAGLTGAGVSFRERVARCGTSCRHWPAELRRCLCVLALLYAVSDVAAVECRPQGTRFERNYCAALDAQAAEQALVAVRARVSAVLADDSHALAAFERANRAWADYVAATLATAFPCAHDDLALCYGDGTPMCVARLRARLAEDRRALLEDLLARPPGPDDCE